MSILPILKMYNYVYHYISLSFSLSLSVYSYLCLSTGTWNTMTSGKRNPLWKISRSCSDTLSKWSHMGLCELTCCSPNCSDSCDWQPTLQELPGPNRIYTKTLQEINASHVKLQHFHPTKLASPATKLKSWSGTPRHDLQCRLSSLWTQTFRPKIKIIVHIPGNPW